MYFYSIKVNFYSLKYIFIISHFFMLLSNSLSSKKITLFIFFNNWVNKGKRKFSATRAASRAVFSCNMLRGNEVTILLS